MVIYSLLATATVEKKERAYTGASKFDVVKAGSLAKGSKQHTPRMPKGHMTGYLCPLTNLIWGL